LSNADVDAADFPVSVAVVFAGVGMPALPQSQQVQSGDRDLKT
jgi:hypothetical protein